MADRLQRIVQDDLGGGAVAESAAADGAQRIGHDQLGGRDAGKAVFSDLDKRGRQPGRQLSIGILPFRRAHQLDIADAVAGESPIADIAHMVGDGHIVKGAVIEGVGGNRMQALGHDDLAGGRGHEGARADLLQALGQGDLLQAQGVVEDLVAHLLQVAALFEVDVGEVAHLGEGLVLDFLDAPGDVHYLNAQAGERLRADDLHVVGDGDLGLVPLVVQQARTFRVVLVDNEVVVVIDAHLNVHLRRVGLSVMGH